jgi:hypothetical protein
MRQGLASFFLPFFKVFLNPKKAVFGGPPIPLITQMASPP